MTESFDKIPPERRDKFARFWTKERRLKAALTPPPKNYCPDVPTDRQRLFLSLNGEREVLFGGAAGGGKSSALLAAALQYVHIPGYAALLVRRTYADLSKPGALIDRAHSWLRKTDAKWNDQKKQWTFPSGATLTFGYLDDENDKYRYQGCFAPDTEYLTTNGWVGVSEVKLGDLVASLNPITREVEYQPVSQVHCYDYAGDMVNIFQTNGVSMEVTPNHSVWFSSQSRGRGTQSKLRKTVAEKLSLNARIPQWGKWQGISAPETISFPKQHNSPGYTFQWADFMEFLGWFVSEGNFSDTSGGLNITQRNPSGVETIAGLLTRMGVKWKYRDKSFRFSCMSLAQYLRKETNALCYNKRLPRSVFQYSSTDLQPLLKALVEGDGTWYKSGRNGSNGVFVSTSEGLADDVSELALICGYRPTKALEAERPEDSRFGAGRPIWRVSLCRRGNTDTSLTTATKTITRNDTGKVYCVTVEPHHTVLIRHRGRVSWSGQSEFACICVDEVTQFSQSQYLYLFSRLRRLASSDIPIRMRAATNPGGVGGRWVYERFIPENFMPIHAVEIAAHWKEGVDDEGRPFKRAFVPARLTDNPHLDQAQYEQSLYELDPVTREQLLNGDWQITQRGDILTTYSEEHTVITWSQFAEVFNQEGEQPHIPKHWLLGVYQDWGATPDHPCVTSWFATAGQNAGHINGVNMAGAVFLYRGLVLDTCTMREVAEHIKTSMAPHGEVARTVRWQMSHEALSERLGYNKEHGLPFAAWETGKTRGITQLKTAFELRDTDKSHPFKPGLMGHPSLYLIVDDNEFRFPKTDRGLARYRAEIPAYHWNVLKSGEPTTNLLPYALFNDAIDTLRAAAADYWPMAKTLTMAEKIEAALPEEINHDALSAATTDYDRTRILTSMMAARKSIEREISRPRTRNALQLARWERNNRR